MSDAATHDCDLEHQYDVYLEALEVTDIRARYGIATDEAPRACYARVLDNGVLKPIAYWYEHDGLHCTLGTAKNATSLDRAAATRWFISAWKGLISEKMYYAVFDGASWPDLDKVVEEQLAQRGIGDNNPPQDPLAQLIENIESAVAAAAQYDNIDDTTTQAAAGLRNRLNELGGEADDVRQKAIGDHYRLYKEAHNKWQPWVDKAKEAAKKILGSLNAWEKKKAKILAEEQAARDAAAKKAAEQAQREADRQIAAGVPPSSNEALQEALQETFAPEPAPIAPQPRPQIRAGYGRAAAVVMVKVPIIVNQDEVYAAFRDYKEVKDVLMKLVKVAVNGGQTVQGVTVTEEPQVR